MRTRHPLRIVAAAAVVAMTAVGAAAGPQAGPLRPPDVAAYLQLAGTYGGGGGVDAVRQVRAWDPLRLDRAVNQLPSVERSLRFCPELSDHVAFATLDAAVLLHTDAALAALSEASGDEAARHIDLAQKILVWTTHLLPESGRPDTGRARGAASSDERAPCGAPLPLAERDWLLAATLLTLRPWALATAGQLADRLAALAPDDAEALFAVGAVREAQALNDAQFNLEPKARLTWSSYTRALERYRSAQRDITLLRGEAAKAFRRAVTIDAGRQDIRLRLGRVLAQLDRFSEAQTELEQVVAAAPSSAERYLAALFLGQVAENQDRPGEAVRWYEHATEVEAAGHVAWTALAHALDRAGLVNLARAALSQALANADLPSDDPWTVYPHGPWQIGDDLLSRLRAKVMHP